MFRGPDRRGAVPEILRFQALSSQMMFELPLESAERVQPLLAQGVGRSQDDPS